MVKFEQITEDNFLAVINLKVDESQEKFVASNTRSLAECYLYRDNNDVFPLAIKVVDKVVGFAMYYTDDEEESATIWRIMIGIEYQNKGYGKEAMKKLEELVKSLEKYKVIYTSYNKDNVIAKNLYLALGYSELKVNEYDEMVVKKQLF